MEIDENGKFKFENYKKVLKNQQDNIKCKGHSVVIICEYCGKSLKGAQTYSKHVRQPLCKLIGEHYKLMEKYKTLEKLSIDNHIENVVEFIQNNSDAYLRCVFDELIEARLKIKNLEHKVDWYADKLFNNSQQDKLDFLQVFSKAVFPEQKERLYEEYGVTYKPYIDLENAKMRLGGEYKLRNLIENHITNLDVLDSCYDVFKRIYGIQPNNIETSGITHHNIKVKINQKSKKEIRSIKLEIKYWCRTLEELYSYCYKTGIFTMAFDNICKKESIGSLYNKNHATMYIESDEYKKKCIEVTERFKQYILPFVRNQGEIQANFGKHFVRKDLKNEDKIKTVKFKNITWDFSNTEKDNLDKIYHIISEFDRQHFYCEDIEEEINEIKNNSNKLVNFKKLTHEEKHNVILETVDETKKSEKPKQSSKDVKKMKLGILMSNPEIAGEVQKEIKSKKEKKKINEEEQKEIIFDDSEPEIDSN